MFASQSNTQPGSRKFVAAADLTGLEGRVVVVANAAGVNQVTPVAALTDVPLFVLVDAGVSGAPVTVEPLDTDSNRRVKLKSTCVAGDKLVLADPGTAADAGKVRKLPATAGAYVQIGVAEETGADGQLVLLRPIIRVIIVPTVAPITQTTSGTIAATHSTAVNPTKADFDALLVEAGKLQADFYAVQAALVANGQIANS